MNLMTDQKLDEQIQCRGVLDEINDAQMVGGVKTANLGGATAHLREGVLKQQQ